MILDTSSFVNVYHTSAKILYYKQKNFLDLIHTKARFLYNDQTLINVKTLNYLKKNYFIKTF